MFDLKFTFKYRFIVIEGHELGNGKTLLGVILAHKYKNDLDMTIASNIELKDFEYNHIRSEEQLFNLENCVIILDESDIILNWTNNEDSQVFYENLFKNARKKNIIVIFITQNVRLLPAKCRELIRLIIFPKIIPYLDYPKKFDYNGKEIESNVVPESILIFRFYNYDEKICSTKGIRLLFGMNTTLIALTDDIIINDLPYWFDKFDTRQYIEDLIKIKLKSRKREKIKED